MPYWSFRPHTLVTAWIALQPATLENGCVRFVAGSNRLGMLEHAASGVTGNSRSLAHPEHIDWSLERAVELEAGDVCFHHCLTIHRSEPNRSERSRRGYTVIYMPAETEYVGAEPYRFPFVHVRGRESRAFRALKAAAEPR
jgi:ectoine hydroxylase-related dioxygenase (phytanoyl-CoA dioxygenase family)